MNPPEPARHDDFERLRRLLKVKHYEVPPPGYFAHFSGRVIARIDHEGRSPVESWWRRATASLWAQPSFSGALGLLAGAVLLSGMGLARTLPPEEFSADPLIAGSPAVVQAALLSWPARSLPADDFVSLTVGASSVTPVTERRSPFNHPDIQSGAVRRASYTP